MSKPKELTTADLVVLAIFLGHGPMHGYELVKKLEEADVEDWAPISVPQVYYSLRKMAELGLIRQDQNTEASLGPSRVIYKPAKSALSQLKLALKKEAWVHHRVPTPFTTWIALASHADIGTIKAQFDRREKYLKTEVKREEKTLAQLDTATGPGVKSAKAMISLAIAQMQTEIVHLPDLQNAVISER